MKIKLFCNVLIVCCLWACGDKNEDIIEPQLPTPNKPEQPSVEPDTKDIVNVNINNTSMAVIGTNDWNSITYGNSKYVVVGDKYQDCGYCVTSTNGVDWGTPVQVTSVYDIDIVTYGNGKYVAVGRDKNYKCCTLYSTNGTSWTVKTIEDQSEFKEGAWEDLIYENNIFVATRDNCVMTSSDGINWSAPKYVGYRFSAPLCFWNGKFLSLDGYAFYESIDAINWKMISSPDSWSESCGVLQCINENGTLIVFRNPFSSSFKRIISLSKDGENWEDFPIDDWDGNNRDKILFSNGVLILICGAGYQTSVDNGMTWSEFNEFNPRLYNMTDAIVMQN